jgi:DNA-binding MarR family transcriptional regulator
MFFCTVTLHEGSNEVDARSKDFGTGTVLHRAEIQTLQAIGRRPGMNLIQLAEMMGVTKGASSQMTSKLVRKGLVRKAASAQSGREIILHLTETGWRAFHEHEKLHESMFAAVRAHYGADLPAGLERNGRR